MARRAPRRSTGLALDASAAAAIASASPRYAARVDRHIVVERVAARCARWGCRGRRWRRAEMPSRCITSARSELPWAVTSTSSPARSWGTITSYQYGQHAGHHVGQALRRRQHVGGEQAVAGVVDRVLGAVEPDRRRGHVVAAAPDLGLLGTVLLGGRLLVEALQGAVVPLVEPPVPLHREPHLTQRLQREVGRDHRPRQQATCGRRRSAAPRRASWRPAALASMMPVSFRGTSCQPVNRLSSFHVLRPWRRRTSVPVTTGS